MSKLVQYLTSLLQAFENLRVENATLRRQVVILDTGLSDPDDYLVKELSECEDDDEYWDELVEEGHTLLKKY